MKETLGYFRILKLHVWQEKFKNLILKARNKELVYQYEIMKKNALVKCLSAISVFISISVMTVLYIYFEQGEFN